jgi:hypothetical protein
VPPKVEVQKISDGLGFGHGSISREAIENEAGDEVAAAVDEAINAPEILTKVDIDERGEMLDDDGCGDGRGVKTVFDKFKTFARSLHRPKVFGGGATMAAASLIGTGKAVGQKLQNTFTSGIALLKKRRLGYGAHTADHVKDPDNDSGCGAIDNAPAIVDAAVTYKDQIRGVIDLLGVDTADLGEVEANFAATAETNRGQAFSGKKVMGQVVDDGKIVKELAGLHIETRIVLNMVEGYTVNQQFVRGYIGGKADVFAVDVWRMQQLAENMYPDEPAMQQKAFLSELVYTLATAAVLTKGDLPVYVIQRVGTEADAPTEEPLGALQNA